jgi:hypothetical protein
MYLLITASIRSSRGDSRHSRSAAQGRLAGNRAQGTPRDAHRHPRVPRLLDVTVLVDSDDPAHVVVYETWESIEHDRAYRAWRASPEGASELGSILAAAPKLTLFTVAEGV